MTSIAKHKLDGSGRFWNAAHVRTDEIGSWFFCRIGTAVRDLSGSSPTALGGNGIQLIVPGAWWTAWWWDEPRWVGIDVIEPVTIPEPDSLAYTDLELDLWWRAEACGIVDEDELEAALAQGLITTQLAQSATEIAGDLLSRLQAGDPLFTTVGFRHLDDAIRGSG